MSQVGLGPEFLKPAKTKTKSKAKQSKLTKKQTKNIAKVTTTAAAKKSVNRQFIKAFLVFFSYFYLQYYCIFSIVNSSTKHLLQPSNTHFNKTFRILTKGNETDIKKRK